MICVRLLSVMSLSVCVYNVGAHAHALHGMEIGGQLSRANSCLLNSIHFVKTGSFLFMTLCSLLELWANSHLLYLVLYSQDVKHKRVCLLYFSEL